MWSETSALELNSVMAYRENNRLSRLVYVPYSTSDLNELRGSDENKCILCPMRQHDIKANTIPSLNHTFVVLWAHWPLHLSYQYRLKAYLVTEPVGEASSPLIPLETEGLPGDWACRRGLFTSQTTRDWRLTWWLSPWLLRDPSHTNIYIFTWILEMLHEPPSECMSVYLYLHSLSRHAHTP